MRYNPLIIISAAIVAALFAYCIHFDILRRIGIYEYHCEGFGCFLGEWLIEFLIGAALVPLIFGISGYCLSRDKRMSHAVSAFVISLILMLVSFIVVGVLDKN